MGIELSIIICTYNRVDLLRQSLESLFVQAIPESSYEIIVVDNNSGDDTENAVIEIAISHPNLSYIKEKQIGLSFARNTGFKAAKSDWVGYIDDDALSNPDLIAQVFKTINEHQFSCFGGAFLPWYVHPKPWWVPNKPRYFTNIIGKPTTCTTLSKGFISGGVAFYKKQLLEEMGGFNTSLGMTGTTINYGEETELQLRIRTKGYVIGYNPDIIIQHYVAPYKLKISWFYKSSFALGKSHFKTFGGKSIWLVSVKSILKAWYVLIKNTILLKYEFKVIMIEKLKCIGLTCGFIAAIFSKKGN